MTTESPHVTGAAKIALFLADHRQRIARLLLWLALASVALAPVALQVAGKHSSWSAGDAFEAVVVAALSCVLFGAWRIAWFVVRNPPARRHDALFLLVFGSWIACIGCGSLWLIATNLNQVL